MSVIQTFKVIPFLLVSILGYQKSFAPIHSDICGPLNVSNHTQVQYYVILLMNDTVVSSGAKAWPVVGPITVAWLGLT